MQQPTSPHLIKAVLMCNTVTKYNFTPKSCFIFIQRYAKLKFKKVTTLSPAQTEVKNNLKKPYKPKMLLHFSSLKSSTVH